MRRLQKGSAADAVKAERLKARRDRIVENFEDGVIDKAERDAKLRVVAEEDEKLASLRWVRRLTVPVDLGDEPEVVNVYLRRLLESITLDATTGLPSKFLWRDPSLRS